MLWVFMISLHSKAQPPIFLPATQPEMVFPLPFNEPTPLSTDTNGGAYGNFYNNRYALGAYHYYAVPSRRTATGGWTGTKDLYLYTFNHHDMNGSLGTYLATLAYRFTESGDTTTLQRGHRNYGGDVSQGAVAPYIMNGNLFVALAYWYGVPSFELNHYRLDEEDEGLHPATGLAGISPIPPANQRIMDLNAISMFMPNPRISIDGNSLDRFAIAYEVPGNGIYVRGYRVNTSGAIQYLQQGTGTGSVGGSPDFKIPGSENGRLPDIALSRDRNSTVCYAFVSYVDTVSLEIKTYRFSFESIFTPYFYMPVLEHTEPISGYSSDIDAFQLVMDAPDDFTTFTGYGYSKWSYSYYNRDANKINLVMSKNGVVNRYVLNNGSIMPGPAAINTSGNAFPAISYTKELDAVHVGWFTTYDMATPFLWRSLYNPGVASQRYIGVTFHEDGYFVTGPHYERLSTNYMNNFTGKGGNWETNSPRLTFSKYNGGDHHFSVFTAHGPSDVTHTFNEVPIFPAPFVPTSIFTGNYMENLKCDIGPVPPAPPLPTIGKYLFYKEDFISCDDSLFNTGENYLYIAHKLSPRFFGGAIYKAAKETITDDLMSLTLLNNPFDNRHAFRLNASALISQPLNAVIYSIDGRQVWQGKGSLEELNVAFQQQQILELSPGIYHLQIGVKGETLHQFKLLKQ
jgi:hypothetical protein